MKRKFILVFFSILLVTLGIVTLTKCHQYYFYYNNRPFNQPNTKWISEDGKITVLIDENKKGRILIKLSDTIVECLLAGGPGYNADVYSLDAKDRLGLYPEEHYESWTCSSKSINEFTITVNKTKFFNIGETLTFHRQY